tara:strand:+ start:91 stop:660 length:570 start_codon:yes stop_codon:yes gene_type:complete
MDYENDLKDILCKCANSEEAIDKITELTVKQNILDILDSEDLGVSIESLGLTEADINNVKYMHLVGDNEDLKEEFAAKDIVSLYRYVAHSSSGYGGSNIGNNSRSFCQKVSKRTNTSLMRYVDILKLNGSNKGFGQGGSNIYSVFRFRGGVNCKHIWVKFFFNKKTKQLVEAPRTAQPKQIDAGDVGNA